MNKMSDDDLAKIEQRIPSASETDLLMLRHDLVKLLAEVKAYKQERRQYHYKGNDADLKRIKLEAHQHYDYEDLDFVRELIGLVEAHRQQLLEQAVLLKQLCDITTLDEKNN